MKVDGKKLTKFILYYSILYIGISYCGFISLPSSLLNVVDLALILLLYLMGQRFMYRLGVLKKEVKHVVFYILLMAIYSLLTGVINLVSLVWILKGARSFLRGFVLLIGMVFYWNEKDVHQFFDFMLKVYPVNFAFIIVQKVLWGNNADLVIGIMGTSLAIYITFIFSYVLVGYMSKKITLLYLIEIMMINFVIAIWGDQRGYYFMFVGVILAFWALERTSIKKILLITGSTAAIVYGMTLMSKYAPASFKTLSSIEAIIEYGTSTSGGYEISRFGAFSEINQIFFKGNLLKNLFGYGLGYCEVNSPFYNAYGFLHYTWFMHQWTFLELGYVGIGLVILFYVLVFMFTKKNAKHIPDVCNQVMYKSAGIMSVVAMITIFYFGLHRSYSGFFLYAILAVPLILLKNTNV